MGNTKHDELATAYQNLQREYTRLKGGELQVGELIQFPCQAEAMNQQTRLRLMQPELTEETIATLTRTIHEQAEDRLSTNASCSGQVTL